MFEFPCNINMCVQGALVTSRRPFTCLYLPASFPFPNGPSSTLRPLFKILVLMCERKCVKLVFACLIEFI